MVATSSETTIPRPLTRRSPADVREGGLAPVQPGQRSLPPSRSSPARGVPRLIRKSLWLLLTALGICLARPQARAELQFDVFVGYDDLVRDGHWFPIAFEILNDGPPFTGTVLFGVENAFDTQQRQFAIELPTGTRKRVVLPAFPSSGRYSRWEARLLDPDGTLVAERNGLQPKDLAPRVPLLGSLPRTFGGLPSLPEVARASGPESIPAVARLQSDYLPSNPIALEGLTAWYLNSERAADLKADQVDALLSWLYGGGHLILAIEQPNDVTALPWLQGILPFVPESIANRTHDNRFETWVANGKSAVHPPSIVPDNPAFTTGNPERRASRRRPPTVDPFARVEPQADFRNAEIPVILGRVTDGETFLSLGDAPVIISAARGRGTVTVLAFSPEREPFRSWKNRPWFWARLMGVPPELLAEAEPTRSGTTIDGLFGAMLDSRQVRKVPIGALLLLLVVYLAVIGPLDQWVLKRLGKQMWTWVTFPVYVVVFSGLIYFIGYRLRAGDLELNEIQVVDQLPRSQGALLRGHTWLSIYSPGNARYRMASELPFASFRAELQRSSQAGRADSGRLIVRQPAKGFDAEVFVPVWVSQLYSSDWLTPGPTVLTADLQSADSGPTLVVENKSDLNFTALAAAFNGRLYALGELPPQGRIERPLVEQTARSLDELAASLPSIYGRVGQRQVVWGSEGSGQIDRNLDGVILASFVDRLRESPFAPSESFASHANFGVNHLVHRGEVVIFGWAPNQSLAAPIHRFKPTRSQRDTVIRLAIPGRRPS